MRRALLFVLVAALALAPGAAAAPRPIVRPADESSKSGVELGSELYAGNCATCHGIAGAGTPIAPSLHGVGALAADFYLRTGYMPLRSPFTQPRRSRVLFSEREIRALVAYVASLGMGPAVPRPDPAAGSVAAGFTLFTQDCAGCHQVAAAGGYLPDSVAPPLYDATPTQIAEAVRIGPNVMPRFSKQRLSDRDLDSVIAYVGYAGRPDDRGGWSLGHVGPVPEGLIAWFIAGVVLVGVTLTAGSRLR
jgi:ubiquinol-cytochrome c reductase cytochrome c subunit